MKEIQKVQYLFNKTNHLLAILLTALLISSCASDPRKVDAVLKETPPTVKMTSYTESLRDLGLMTEIYATGPLKMQSNPIGDVTGTSGSTGGEIPRDITEMIKSSINSIGGNVIYIPYDPAFMQNQMVTGYSNFENKIIPDVILSGGITEFDRGLSTKGENTDFSGSVSVPKGIPTNILGSADISARSGSGKKEGLARITLDFNLLNFETMTGIPRMNTVTTMEVHKSVAGKEMGIGLFGINFGLKGTSKKVQGRHAAIRLLVELSMIQIVGKHLALPYWKLLGDDAKPDEVVMKAIERFYYSLNQSEVIAYNQEWLFLFGYDVPQSGVLDQTTIAALKEVDPHYNVTSGKINVDTFTNVYISMPIDEKTLGRRVKLAKLYSESAPEESAVLEEETVSAPSYQQAAQPEPESSIIQVEETQKVEETQNVRPKRKPGKGIGRILSDDEW